MSLTRHMVLAALVIFWSIVGCVVTAWILPGGLPPEAAFGYGAVYAAGFFLSAVPICEWFNL